jgi:dsDNA-specific endonuclease/ATPase MutS2
MITHQQYQQAKQQIATALEQIREAEKITNAYEAQEKTAKAKRLLLLRKNDYVEYIGGSSSRVLTVGKKYRLTSESFKGRLALINDSGNRMLTRPKFFKF